MKMKLWTTFTLLILLVLTACAAPSNVPPTPTIVRLDRSVLTPTAQMEVAEADVLPTATSTLPPGATFTPTLTLVATTTVTATLQPAAQATPIPTATATPAAPQAEITSAGLNVREGPGVSYATIGTVAKGDKLDIAGVSANGNWLKIVTPDGKKGWISSQSAYIRIIGSLENLSEAAANSGSVSSVKGMMVTTQTLTATVQGVTNNSQPVSTGTTADGKLVFATRSGGDLYLVNIDGTSLRKLASAVVDPVMSPDGKQVAFTRWDETEFGALYVLDLNDGSERVIANDVRQPKSPTWSQDGQEIVFSFQHGGTVDPKEECRKFDSDDGSQLPSIGKITHIRRSSDGVEICFIRREDLQWGLRHVNLSTGEFKDLPADLYSFNPTWDPQNSTRVIYDGERGLMQLDIATGQLQSFTSDANDTAPIFSPDGKKLALTYRQHDHWETYTYDLATGSHQRLTKPPLLADPQYSSAAPAWSPDGSQIAFVTDRTGQWEIWVMNADGSNQHSLFSSEVQAQLGFDYQGVNERLLNWID